MRERERERERESLCKLLKRLSLKIGKVFLLKVNFVRK